MSHGAPAGLLMQFGLYSIAAIGLERKAYKSIRKINPLLKAVC
jgi:hypothetical protein